MAYTGMVIMLLVTVFGAGASAQSSCTIAFISLFPCLNYTTRNSLKPSTQCCSKLASVVKSSPECLCQVVLNGGDSSLGIKINRTRALATPSACNIQTPPVGLCNAASPAESPAGVLESPTTIPTRGGRVSTTVPTIEENGISNASSIKLSTSLLFLLLVASYVVSIFQTY